VDGDAVELIFVVVNIVITFRNSELIFQYFASLL